MNVVIKCRCCNLQPAIKNLNSTYSRMGNMEVYGDMLKNCFQIDLTKEGDNGICDVCVPRLCDAWDFKQQVQRCQKDFKKALVSTENDIKPKVKEEIFEADDDNNIFLYDLKQEMDSIKQENNEINLSKLIDLTEITVKKAVSEKKHDKKLTQNKQRHKTDGKTINIVTLPRKITFRTIPPPDKPKRSIKITTSSRYFISEQKQCQHNISNILKYSNCVPFSNKTLSGYVCHYCKESFHDPKNLRTHTQSTHQFDELSYQKRIDKNNISVKMDITDLSCNICSAKIDVISNLKKHLMKEHDIKFYNGVKDYILEFKLTNSDILQCALCNSTYETFKMLLQHMNGHYRNYICDICDIGFINKHRLGNHKRTHETGTFKCDFCDKIFTTKIRKAFHEKYSHKTSVRYLTNCPHCDQKFTNYYQRNRHMMTEHNTQAATYKCNVCDRSFIMKSKLTSHIKKDHLMERNHICSTCGHAFFTKKMLDEHMLKHNGERIHQCTVCNKAYARKKTLREHMRIHNNDRRFKCDICGLTFVQKCSMKSHMLTHHGVTLSDYEVKRDIHSLQGTISVGNVL